MVDRYCCCLYSQNQSDREPSKLYTKNNHSIVKPNSSILQMSLRVANTHGLFESGSRRRQTEGSPMISSSTTHLLAIGLGWLSYAAKIRPSQYKGRLRRPSKGREPSLPRAFPLVRVDEHRWAASWFVCLCSSLFKSQR